MRAVLVDVLGTLVFLEPPAPRLRAQLAAHGIDVAEHEAAAAAAAEISYYLANHMDGATPESLDDLRDRCAGEIVRTLGLPDARLAAVRRAMLDALVFTPFPDAAPALSELRSLGMSVVAASNWDCSLPWALERAGLSDVVDAAVSSAVAGAAKPAPAVFLAALEAAGCELSEALFVGDSLENDVRGAQAVGMRALLLARGGEPAAGGESIRSLAELPSLISSP